MTPQANQRGVLESMSCIRIMAGLRRGISMRKTAMMHPRGFNKLDQRATLSRKPFNEPFSVSLSRRQKLQWRVYVLSIARKGRHNLEIRVDQNIGLRHWDNGSPRKM